MLKEERSHDNADGITLIPFDIELPVEHRHRFVTPASEQGQPLPFRCSQSLKKTSCSPAGAPPAEPQLPVATHRIQRCSVESHELGEGEVGSCVCDEIQVKVRDKATAIVAKIPSGQTAKMRECLVIGGRKRQHPTNNAMTIPEQHSWQRFVSGFFPFEVFEGGENNVRAILQQRRCSTFSKTSSFLGKGDDGAESHRVIRAEDSCAQAGHAVLEKQSSSEDVVRVKRIGRLRMLNLEDQVGRLGQRTSRIEEVLEPVHGTELPRAARELLQRWREVQYLLAAVNQEKIFAKGDEGERRHARHTSQRTGPYANRSTVDQLLDAAFAYRVSMIIYLYQHLRGKVLLCPWAMRLGPRKRPPVKGEGLCCRVRGSRVRG